MERFFKTQEGKLVNIVEHTLEQIEKWPHLKIYVGTDSQNYGDKTRYVTCIVYRYGHRGAHFVYFRDEVPRIRDSSEFTRLYDEGVRTLSTADILTTDIPVAVEGLEFDFADIAKTLSSKLVGAFKGYNNAVFKSGKMMAVKAADHVCRHPNDYK